MMTNLVETVKSMNNDPSVRVIVLTGSGETFCTGMDLHRADQSSADSLSVIAEKGVAMFESVCFFSKYLSLS